MLLRSNKHFVSRNRSGSDPGFWIPGLAMSPFLFLSSPFYVYKIPQLNSMDLHLPSWMTFSTWGLRVAAYWMYFMTLIISVMKLLEWIRAWRQHNTEVQQQNDAEGGAPQQPFRRALRVSFSELYELYEPLCDEISLMPAHPPPAPPLFRRTRVPLPPAPATIMGRSSAP